MSSKPTRQRTLRVALDQAGASTTILSFDRPFRIGSDPRSDLVITSGSVSRSHAEVVYEDDCWWIRAAEGSKGVFLAGKPVQALPLADGTSVTLGPKGPALTFTLAPPEKPTHRPLRLPDPLRSVVRASTRIISVEEHKKIMREIMVRVRRFEARKYVRILASAIVLGLGAAAFAYYKHVQYEALESQAQEFFYEMKSFELMLARLESRLAGSGDSAARVEVVQAQRRLEQLRTRYDEYLEDLGIYEKGRDDKIRAIYRVARVFGECEVAMPKGFTDEVERYINEWKLSDRLVSSLGMARERGYVPLITEAMLDQHLPPQFLYVALQESGFDSTACGPRTRFGIAKGMWQFMPTTAQQYGLRTGPLVELPRLDPRDDRHWVTKSTVAASRYLRDIYESEAQASGLLVIASYNWGHNRVDGLIRAMPENPRERNFWEFLKTYKSEIPQQTYDYVYMILSAAVIAENPALFGFDFDKPINTEEF